jgi:polc: DNA polymerase III, alpha subunit
VIIR